MYARKRIFHAFPCIPPSENRPDANPNPPGELRELRCHKLQSGKSYLPSAFVFLLDALYESAAAPSAVAPSKRSRADYLQSSPVRDC